MPTTCAPSLDSEVKSGFFPIAFAGRAMRDGAARVDSESPGVASCPATAVRAVSDNAKQSERYRLSALTDRHALPRLCAIGATLIAVAGWFAYVAGWLSPGVLTQGRVVDRFEHVSGVHPGFRRNHAKGVCITGMFESNGQGVRLSKAAVFKLGRMPVVGRFSLGGGNPQMTDEPSAVLAMGLRLRPPGGEEWRMAMIHLPVFVVRDVHGFYEQLLASKPDPRTGKPDPQKLAAFAATHPEFVRAMQVIKSGPSPSGFATANYNSLNAFRFINAAGDATPVRWSMVASEAPLPTIPEQVKGQDKNYLFDDMIARLGRGPLQWHLIVTLAQPGDVTNDATVPWPATREQVDVGTLTIDRAETEGPGNCRDIVFDPLVLPWGIEASDDPLLSGRSATYSDSFRRREGEKKTPSDFQVPIANKGS
jgi:catalase